MRRKSLPPRSPEASATGRRAPQAARPASFSCPEPAGLDIPIGIRIPLGMPMTAAVPTRHELPPGPSLPGAAQTLRWVVRPTAFMEECRRRYGDCFTLRIASEGRWVLVSDPESIRRVFTGNPEHLRAGEANAILRPVVGSESVLLLDGPSHLR